MDLYPSPEQQELAVSARRIIERHFPLTGRDVHLPTDEEWSAVAEQGWFGLSLSEELSGFGGAVADEVQVHLEIGRLCVPGSILATSLAARVAALAGIGMLVESLVSGETRAGLAFAQADRDDLVAFDLPADAGLLLVIDESTRHVGLWSTSDVIVEESLQCIDPSVSATRIRLGSAPQASVAAEHADDVIQRGTVLIAAELAGIADATTALSVDYAKVREQFGRPIGTFQAISHRCADMAVRARAAVAAVDLAAVTFDEDGDARRAVASARLYAEVSALENARVTIQTHGAIAFTAEHVAHRYLKRARLLAGLFGRAEDQVEVIRATRVGEAPISVPGAQYNR